MPNSERHIKAMFEMFPESYVSVMLVVYILGIENYKPEQNNTV